MQKANLCLVFYSWICKTQKVGIKQQPFKQLFDVNNSDTDTDSLCPALVVKELENNIRLQMETDWEQLRSKYCPDCFTSDAVGTFSPWMCCDKHEKPDLRGPGLFEEDFGCSEMVCFCSKNYCCYDTTFNKLKFSTKRLKKQTLEQSGDGPLENYRKILDERVNIKPTNRSFRTKDHTVAQYEQTKRGFS